MDDFFRGLIIIIQLLLAGVWLRFGIWNILELTFGEEELVRLAVVSDYGSVLLQPPETNLHFV